MAKNPVSGLPLKLYSVGDGKGKKTAKNPGKIISFDEMINKKEEYVPLCQRMEAEWPCPEVCGEMCINWCTDRCLCKESE